MPNDEGAPLLLAAFDKFRGTLTAREACDAATSAATDAGIRSVSSPLADGGYDGHLRVMHRTTVAGAAPQP